VNKLNEAVNNRVSLEAMSKQFAALDIDINHFLNDKPFDMEDIHFGKLRAIINEKKHALKPENNRPYFGTIFLQIFDESYEHASSIDKSTVALKRKYIEWQHSLHQSAFIKKLEKGYDKQVKLLNDAILVKKKMDGLKKI